MQIASVAKLYLLQDGCDLMEMNRTLLGHLLSCGLLCSVMTANTVSITVVDTIKLALLIVTNQEGKKLVLHAS